MVEQTQTEDLTISTINLGGYYLGITEMPLQRWVELTSILPLLSRDMGDICDHLLVGEFAIVTEETGQQHYLIDLLIAYQLLLTEGGDQGKIVAKQLYTHYKVLDRMFFEAKLEEVVESLKKLPPDQRQRILG
jgi:hypothetical protein